MAGLGSGTSTMSLYYLKSYGVLIGAGALGSLHFVKAFASKLTERGKALQLAGYFIIFAVFGLATSFIIGDSYNPFLYFRF